MTRFSGLGAPRNGGTLVARLEHMDDIVRRVDERNM
jgi:hypothetical protein